MLVHSVYFYLRPELSAEQRAAFKRGVETLKGIRGVEAVHVGTPAPVPDRPVIEKDYGVALTVLCKDVAAHNAYQADPIHLAFIAENKACWTHVRVFDSE